MKTISDEFRYDFALAFRSMARQLDFPDGFRHTKIYPRMLVINEE